MLIGNIRHPAGFTGRNSLVGACKDLPSNRDTLPKRKNFMKEREFQFDSLVQPYYPTLNHFAAGVCGNPLIASILVAEMFTRKKVGLVKSADDADSEWGAHPSRV